MHGTETSVLYGEVSFTQSIDNPNVPCSEHLCSECRVPLYMVYTRTVVRFINYIFVSASGRGLGNGFENGRSDRSRVSIVTSLLTLQRPYQHYSCYKHVRYMCQYVGISCTSSVFTFIVRDRITLQYVCILYQ